VADALVGIGGAFLAAGIFARFGRRVGLPTIPFFMAAGIVFGPHTPGLALVEHTAAFFFAFGVSIEPSALGDVAGPVLVAVALSLVLNLAAGVAAARLNGLGRVAAANIGLTVLGRGELSLVLATLAAAAGLDERIAPFVAFYVLILAIAGPLLTACSGRVAGLLPSRMLAAVGSP
jgi:CPA2 family monovalent cation:H+ antiporter-2